MPEKRKRSAFADGNNDSASSRKATRPGPRFRRSKKAHTEPSSKDADERGHDAQPQCHSREHPPKQREVQNVSWTEVPAEVRNVIYSYLVTNEREKIFWVLHRSACVSRRLESHTMHTNALRESPWNFTQVDRRTREELAPLLIDNRKVCTNLSTFDRYVEVFHPIRPDGHRYGWVQPVSYGQVLPRRNGIDVLDIVEAIELDPNFHIQLDRVERDPSQLLMLPMYSPEDYDEVTLLRDIIETFPEWRQANQRNDITIEGINMYSICKNGLEYRGIEEDWDWDANGEEEPDSPVGFMEQRPLLEFVVTETFASEREAKKDLTQYLNTYLRASRLMEKEFLRIRLVADCGTGRWVTRRSGLGEGIWE